MTIHNYNIIKLELEFIFNWKSYIGIRYIAASWTIDQNLETTWRTHYASRERIKVFNIYFHIIHVRIIIKYVICATSTSYLYSQMFLSAIDIAVHVCLQNEKINSPVYCFRSIGQNVYLYYTHQSSAIKNCKFIRIGIYIHKIV